MGPCLLLVTAWVGLADVAHAQELAAPSDTQLKLYEEGAAAYQAGEFDKASRLFQASIDLGPLNVTYLNLGRALFRLGRCDEARAALDAARSAPRVADPPHEAVMDKIVEYSLDLADCVPSGLVVTPSLADVPEPAIAASSIASQPSASQPGPDPLDPKAEPLLIAEAHMGILVAGTGTFDGGCEGDCTAVMLMSEDADDKSVAGFGADVFLRVAPELYLGLGVLYAPSTEFDANIEGFSELGSDLSLHGGAAWRTPIARDLTLDLRAQLGPLLLFPDGDLGTLIAEQKTLCAEQDCTVDEGPYVGLTASAGVGGTYDLGTVGVTAALSLQYIDLSLHRLRVQTTTLTTTYAGLRGWLFVGLSL